ncbi:hypothetical protein [Aestuariibius sp. HNIBRBA575]|uniref:hypothetical protein n=1 Tax=Aestuariibius sp. HNIBRBA575 TaxID=3233343 RepID=UPI0034A5BF41
MLNDQSFRSVVARACLAPSVHNIQPTRWHRSDDGIDVFCDLTQSLPVGDPHHLDAGLSSGAAIEATVLALSEMGVSAQVEERWDAHSDLKPVAHIRLQSGLQDGLSRQLENRFTWRGKFADQTPDLFGWSRSDTFVITDAKRRNWLAELNDQTSYRIMQNPAFRKELLSWMRLRDTHPRLGLDGMGREACQMSDLQARMAGLALGPLWGMLNLFGATKSITSEAEATKSAPVIAAFHQPTEASPIARGRAYLRMWLEATSLGFSGWPMAALSDDPSANAEICARLGIGADRDLVQVIRFGVAMGPPPARARRPLDELII